MEVINESVNEMWLEYLKLNEEERIGDGNYNVLKFGGTKEGASELIEFILKGEKRGSTSLKDWYEFEGKTLPKLGDLIIITDYDNIAKCIVKTEKVTVIPFCDVTEELALREGEMFKSLEQWKDVHRNFFEGQLKEVGKMFIEDMFVVCHEFKVIF